MNKQLKKPWQQTMPQEQFQLMQQILSAPSPINLEGAMTHGLLKPFFEKVAPTNGKVQTFKNSASIVLDTDPNDTTGKLTVMLIGHADKIRLQVRSIDNDGKIWINSDSFLPCTLIGHEVILFSEDPKNPGNYRMLEGGTIEALGAIHFSKPNVRTGDKGISPEMLFLELQTYGENPKQQLEDLGIRAGDTIILNRPIKRGFSADTFYGAYLDNGLGCFTVAEVARLMQSTELAHIRIQYAIVAHEEIGCFGSAIVAGELKPDAIIATDVSHDYDAAPGISDRRMNSIGMNKGVTIGNGAITSNYFNSIIQKICLEQDIPFQMDVLGRHTGTDSMAPALSATDIATTSLGFPIRNMHTISETGHTGDVLATIYAIYYTLLYLEKQAIKPTDLQANHPDLSKAKSLNK